MSQKQYPSMNRAATERGLASSTSKGTGHVAGDNTGQPSLVSDAADKVAAEKRPTGEPITSSGPSTAKPIPRNLRFTKKKPTPSNAGTSSGSAIQPSPSHPPAVVPDAPGHGFGGGEPRFSLPERPGWVIVEFEGSTPVPLTPSERYPVLDPFNYDRVSGHLRRTTVRWLRDQWPMTESRLKRLEDVIKEDNELFASVDVYCVIHWRLVASNSMKAKAYHFQGYPEGFSAADPYDRQGTLPLYDGHSWGYPRIDPSDIVENPTIYRLSRPHYPYLTRYADDPPLDYHSIIQDDLRNARPWIMSQHLRERLVNWFEVVYELYLAWNHLACCIHIVPFRPSWSSPSHQFASLYPFCPQQTGHNPDPLVLADFCRGVYEMRAWCTYAMFTMVDVIHQSIRRPLLHHPVDENMMGATFFDDLDLSDSNISTLHRHGVPIFQVRVWDGPRTTERPQITAHVATSRPVRVEQHVRVNLFFEESASSILWAFPWIVHPLTEANMKQSLVWIVADELGLSKPPRPIALPQCTSTVLQKHFGRGVNIEAVAKSEAVHQPRGFHAQPDPRPSAPPHFPPPPLPPLIVGHTASRLQSQHPLDRRHQSTHVLPPVAPPVAAPSTSSAPPIPDSSGSSDSGCELDISTTMVMQRKYPQQQGESRRAYSRRIYKELQRVKETLDHPEGRLLIAGAYLGSEICLKRISEEQAKPALGNKAGRGVRTSTLRLYLDKLWPNSQRRAMMSETELQQRRKDSLTILRDSGTSFEDLPPGVLSELAVSRPAVMDVDPPSTMRPVGPLASTSVGLVEPQLSSEVQASGTVERPRTPPSHLMKRSWSTVQSPTSPPPRRPAPCLDNTIPIRVCIPVLVPSPPFASPLPVIVPVPVPVHVPVVVLVPIPVPIPVPVTVLILVPVVVLILVPVVVVPVVVLVPVPLSDGSQSRAHPLSSPRLHSTPVQHLQEQQVVGGSLTSTPFVRIPAHKWFKVEVSTQCWDATLPHHLVPANLAAQYRSRGVWGVKANMLRSSLRKDLKGNNVAHAWRHTFLLKELNFVDSFKQFIFTMGHFFDDHTTSMLLSNLKGIAAFASADDLVYISCVYEHAINEYEQALLRQLAPPPLHHDIIPDVVLDYWSYPPIPASPHQVLQKRTLQCYTFSTSWLSERIASLPSEQRTIQLRRFEMICCAILLYYSAGIDRNAYGGINFVAEIWPVQGGEMNVFIRRIAAWAREKHAEVTISSRGSEKEELQFKKGMWTLQIDADRSVGEFLRPLSK
ncbi:uncharacterized protein EI90DRAFT_3138026 [Cantharellus anzutake]|uniref:uncharacterized protein n=1 Tax=Cantharellus anzutake TaxID=1750568 RepID=UPI00190407CE|nr:uncharacterized protein EI90DRAFT_3138026 [Cantharellus anzutake]KAF8311776.1 hypothetical protein EI90DRAFT_3138026 [Cantharellus anzutake]